MWLIPVGVLSLAYILGTPATPVDLRADRLTALAAIDGANPYQPVSQLAERYGSDLWWEWIHPRTPGALVLMAPLTLLGEEWMRELSVVGTAAAIAALAVLVARELGLSQRAAVPIALVAGMISIAVEAASVGAQSSVVALLLAVAWLRLRSSDDVPGGLAIGLATTLKVFPWLLIVMIAWRRPRAGVAAVAVTGVTNLVGLALPGVSVPGMFDALASANQSAPLELNASLSRIAIGWQSLEFLSIGLAIVGLVFAVLLGRSAWRFDQMWFGGVALALATSPLIWSHYALALIPGFIWMIQRGGVNRLVGSVIVLACLIPAPVLVAWFVVPAAIVVTIGAAVFVGSGESKTGMLSVHG